jgi:hypothetical protein
VIKTVTQTNKQWRVAAEGYLGTANAADTARWSYIREEGERKEKRLRSFVRINPVLSKMSSLDNASAIEAIVDETKAWLGMEGKIQMHNISHRLLASLFYLHLVSGDVRGLVGEIRCKIGPSDNGYQTMIEKMRAHVDGGHDIFRGRASNNNAYVDIIQDKAKFDRALQIRLPVKITLPVGTDMHVYMTMCDFRETVSVNGVTERPSEVNKDPLPISGCPRFIDENARLVSRSRSTIWDWTT